MKKIIGCTPRCLKEGSTLKQFVNDNYVESLLARDFNVIMLTLDNPALEEILDLCDGFLITGGSDIDPKWFNEENNGSEDIDPRLDMIDKQVVEYAMKSKKPMLGICRGIQSINVFMGGSLYQHIGLTHRGISYDHEVHTYKNRLLDFDKDIIVNSYHHQAVKELAPNTTLVAKHKDGTIEAFIHNTLPIIAVQWHPERLQETKPSQIVFDTFAKLVNKKC